MLQGNTENSKSVEMESDVETYIADTTYDFGASHIKKLCDFGIVQVRCSLSISKTDLLQEGYDVVSFVIDANLKDLNKRVKIQNIYIDDDKCCFITLFDGVLISKFKLTFEAAESLSKFFDGSVRENIDRNRCWSVHSKSEVGEATLQICNVKHATNLKIHTDIVVLDLMAFLLQELNGAQKDMFGKVLAKKVAEGFSHNIDSGVDQNILVDHT